MFPFREYAAVLDFFSPEARELVRSSPPLPSLPQEVLDRAVGRLLWRSGSEMVVGFSQEEVRKEVLSFFLMCQALASVSYPYSREVRLAGGKTEEVVRYRLYHLFGRGYEFPCLEVMRRYLRVEELGELGGRLPREDLFRIRNQSLRKAGILLPPESVPPQHQPRYSLPWTDLAPLLRVGRVQLTELYLVGGRAVVTPYQLWDLFSGLMGLKCEEYVASLYERFSERGEPPELLVKVGERISSLLPPPEVELGTRFPRGRLREEFFPPCVKRALAGVSSGGRNYAITVLLTSFLSHARLPPPGRAVTKIRDLPEGFSVVKEEIIPLIFEAAQRCRPPLFVDQPQEKANVYYHLGFGMTTDPRPEDSGRSKWYRPPNCQKISSSAPFLCTPDEWCREIKNPLTYYYKRLRLEGRRDGVPKGDAGGEKEVLPGGVEQA
jgi:DNA primase large subunit